MMTVDKPFSQACENNKGPILEVLTPLLMEFDKVLEIGSGTGQHAVHFAQALPHLQWLTSDRSINHAGILSWQREAKLSNLQPPLLLDLNEAWPIDEVPVIYTANTLHIISKELVERFFTGVKKHLSKRGLLVIYGPFNYAGQFTSESNAAFHQRLLQRDPLSGVRDSEWIIELARHSELSLQADHAMPANNRLLIFKR
jgi:cyclopropane fatty-acyl-phospholipid synthase-like methyltransferase